MQLKDSNGNNLTASGGSVLLNTTLGTIGTVTDRQDGTYTATLTAATTAGTAIITATLNDAAFAGTATVEMTSVVAEVFDEYRSEVRQIILAEAERALHSTLNVNQRMVRDARERFIASQGQTAHCSQLIDDHPDITLAELEGCDNGEVTRNDVPFDVTGTAGFINGVLSTTGSFFEQRGNVAGTKRRLFFGEFDIQHDLTTGSSTATLTARLAWEHTVSERAMIGYFIGGEFAQSDIRSITFAGDNRRYGATIGGYAVYQLRENLYADGFVTLGMGRNDLDMANGVLSLKGSYTTRTATIGGSLNGVVDYGHFELRPELSVSYGKTWIGTVGFTGWAYGLVDDMLSLNVGSISLARIMVRPEFRIPLDEGRRVSGGSVVTFAPRAVCEISRGLLSRTTCGVGAELGLKARSADGRTNVDAGFSVDRVGKSTQTSVRLNVQYRF